MNFDTFRPDSSPPDIPDPSVAIAEGQRRRARRRALGGGTVSLALVVLAVAILSPGETRQPVVADDSTAAAACRLEDLSVSHAGVGLATGHWGDRLLLQNVGRRACVLEGYPTVTGLADHESRGGVGAIQTLSGYIGGRRTSTEPVELVRGAVAEAVVEGSTVPEPGEVCETFGAFAVYLPGAIPAGSQKGATSLLRLVGSWEHCGELQVHPFAPHTVSGGDCPALEDDLPVTTIRSQPGTAGDGVNDRFEAPGDATPALSAQDARAVLSDNALSRPVDAVLARWTNLNGDGPSRLVWILRNMYTVTRPSRGPLVCGEVSYLLDATDGSVLSQRAGNTVLASTTTLPAEVTADPRR